MHKKEKELNEKNEFLEKQLVDAKDNLGNVLNDLAEAENNCVKLEEEKQNIKNNKGNETNKKTGFIQKLKKFAKKK